MLQRKDSLMFQNQLVQEASPQNRLTPVSATRHTGGLERPLWCCVALPPWTVGPIKPIAVLFKPVPLLHPLSVKSQIHSSHCMDQRHRFSPFLVLWSQSNAIEHLYVFLSHKKEWKRMVGKRVINKLEGQESAREQGGAYSRGELSTWPTGK